MPSPGVIYPSECSYTPLKPSTKRDDLQGVRGLAIIFVLLFHFYPDTFRNGFAGVDIFFVLSGYLMQMIYAERTSGLYSILSFYKRRFIRLLPLYYLTVLATLLAGRCLLLETDSGFLKKDARWALLLGSNAQGLVEQRGYFDLVSEFSFLLHTWSLAVEMQFYLLAPLFFLLLGASDSPSKKLLLCLGFAAPSFCLHVLAAGPLSFDFLLSRIWQFLLGAASAIATVPKIRRGNEIHFVLYCALILLCLPLSLEVSLTEKFVRLLATLLAAVLFALGPSVNHSTFAPNYLATNRFLTYTGDISYVVYLVHWPAILFYKYANDVQHLALHEVFGLLLVIVGVSVAIHHLIEKPLLTEHLASALVSVLCLTASFYLLYAPTKKTPTIISTVPSEEIKEDFYWRKETAINANWTHEQLVQNAIAKNLDWEKNGVHFHKPPGCNPQHYPPAHCTMPVRNGSVKAIVAGNSFTYRAMGPIYETLKDKYSQLQMVMVSRCELFTTDFATYHSDKSECGSLAQQTHNATEAMEPDVLFLITRYLGNFTEEIKNITTDRWVQNALLHLEELSNSTKAIVISSPIHRFSFRVPKVIARQLQHKKNITEVDYTYEVFEKEHRNTMERLRFIVARCPKCFYFDMQRPFCAEDGLCATYDKETLLPFISDEEHISYRGNEVLFPSLKKLVDDILAKNGL